MRIDSIAPIGRSMGNTLEKVQRSFSRLPSGRRINSAADDAAGVSLASNLSAQIASLEQASRNVDHGVSMAQIADAAMASQDEIGIRISELTIQAGNGALGGEERQAIQNEMDELSAELTRISESTSYNGTPLLQGGSVAIQAGISGSTTDVVDVDLSDRSQVGASINRLRSAQDNLAVTVENESAALSRVADADVAAESSTLAGGLVQLKAHVAMSKKVNMVKGMMVSLIA